MLPLKAEHCIHTCISHKLTTHTGTIKGTTGVSPDIPRDNFDVEAHKWDTTLLPSACPKALTTHLKKETKSALEPPTMTMMLNRHRSKVSCTSEHTDIWAQCRNPLPHPPKRTRSINRPHMGLAICSLLQNKQLRRKWETMEDGIWQCLGRKNKRKF